MQGKHCRHKKLRCCRTISTMMQQLLTIATYWSSTLQFGHHHCLSDCIMLSHPSSTGAPAALNVPSCDTSPHCTGYCRQAEARYDGSELGQARRFYRLSVTSYRLSVTSYRLSVTFCRLSVTSYRVSVRCLYFQQAVCNFLHVVCNFLQAVCNFLQGASALTGGRLDFADLYVHTANSLEVSWMPYGRHLERPCKV
jgi:hypothetical protein